MEEEMWETKENKFNEDKGLEKEKGENEALAAPG